MASLEPAVCRSRTDPGGGDRLTGMTSTSRYQTVAVATGLWVALIAPVSGQAQPQERFVSTFAPEAMHDKQAVIETDAGSIVLDLLADVAPNHVGLFMTLAADGVFDGTTFHRMVARGVIQGGDPLTKDPSRTDVYGRGGLNLVAAEPNEERHTRGAVSAVVIPGQPDSGGSQFFICVVDQPALDGEHTVWARVAEGMDVVTRISETPVDETGLAAERVTIRSVTIRDRPPDVPIAFTEETDADLAGYRAVLETDRGDIVVDLYPDRAPRHVRNFLRLAEEGVYDGMSFHRVVPGFVIQTGFLPSREAALTDRQQGLIESLEPEFTETRHVRGIVSMARGEELASASTSFFICTDTATELDGQYTVFGVVVEGLEVVDAIEAVPTDDDERPLERVALRTVRVTRRVP